MNNKKQNNPLILQKGDRVNLSITAFNETEEIKKWEREEILLTLGKNEYLEGFDDLLIGLEKQPFYQLDLDYKNKKTSLVEKAHFEVIDRDFLPRFAHETARLNVQNEKKLNKVNDEIEVLKKSLESRDKEIWNLQNTIKESAKNFEEKAKDVLNKKSAELKKHSDEKIAETKKYGSKKLLESILPTLNNFLLAVQWGEKSDNQEVKNYVYGFSSLLKQLDNAFESNNVIKISPTIGDVYNPEYHQIVETNQDETKENETINSVLSPGYMLHDQVVIPARVNIIKNNS